MLKQNTCIGRTPRAIPSTVVRRLAEVPGISILPIPKLAANRQLGLRFSSLPSPASRDDQGLKQHHSMTPLTSIHTHRAS